MSSPTPLSPGSFPSLIVRADALVPCGPFAEAQAAFLDPDRDSVARLDRGLAEQGIGVVAHFYMDAELQGALTACEWPHIHVADSLAMAERAVAMAEAGVKAVVVLGVDFMSENVRATLDAAGHADVAVYRVAEEPIGCSLAEAAEAEAYAEYLRRASERPRSLHVIYVNTSLLTKARAQALVPTITCTSSNVVQTVLQAFSEIDDLSVWYGPDTYMGENLAHMFERLAGLDADVVRRLHAAHTPDSVASALDRFEYFRQGACVVHHMFGHEVVERVRRDYADAYVTAHFEVPGEMFHVALDAADRDAGVVGSTSNILAFIERKVTAAAAAGGRERLRFILGTESGMVTSIVRSLQRILGEAKAGAGDVEAEIVFPVASEAVAESDDAELAVIPGVAGGEGCSVAGGCATCPYMKMNSLDALTDMLGLIGRGSPSELSRYEPRKYVERVDGSSAAELGGVTIASMRAFQKTGRPRLHPRYREVQPVPWNMPIFS